MTKKRTVWEILAEHNGWLYSPAYGGYIRPDHRDENGNNPSDLTAEDACFLDGIETEAQAEIEVVQCEGCKSDFQRRKDMMHFGFVRTR